MSHPASLKTRIDAAIGRAITDNRLVGAVVLVAEDGEITCSHTAGFLDGRRARRCGKMRSSASPRCPSRW
ncbi:hypothetical protein QE408_003963 [Agrobacterium larrymoorei]|uniref:Beta-lactamase family protein n=1 Tax=Agrobacterium larrymoorei TaxID=160699 RepID=A0ABU0UPD9_9HYPH|nr:hypothetical protein [Agrobacterium larrymoorei]